MVDLLNDNGHASLLQKVRKKEWDVGVFPPEELNGRKGITSACNLSFDLANESHCDCGDAGMSFSAFAESKAGTAENWRICFPNMKVWHERKMHFGAAIALCHGALVGWDGRVMKHFTSVTDVGEGNNVHGCFCGPCRRNTPKELRPSHMRDAKNNKQQMVICSVSSCWACWLENQLTTRSISLVSAFSFHTLPSSPSQTSCTHRKTEIGN